MELSKLRKVFVALAVAAVMPAFADGPNVWYVKASNYGLDGLTGEDEEHAWGTLQDAHDNAAAGDTIYVLPGTYDQGSTKGNSLASRLVVSKQLHFVATGSAAETEIVGSTFPSPGRPSLSARGGTSTCSRARTKPWPSRLRPFRARRRYSAADATSGARLS